MKGLSAHIGNPDPGSISFETESQQVELQQQNGVWKIKRAGVDTEFQVFRVQLGGVDYLQHIQATSSNPDEFKTRMIEVASKMVGLFKAASEQFTSKLVTPVGTIKANFTGDLLTDSFSVTKVEAEFNAKTSTDDAKTVKQTVSAVAAKVNAFFQEVVKNSLSTYVWFADASKDESKQSAVEKFLAETGLSESHRKREPTSPSDRAPSAASSADRSDDALHRLSAGSSLGDLTKAAGSRETGREALAASESATGAFVAPGRDSPGARAAIRAAAGELDETAAMLTSSSASEPALAPPPRAPAASLGSLTSPSGLASSTASGGLDVSPTASSVPPPPSTASSITTPAASVNSLWTTARPSPSSASATSSLAAARLASSSASSTGSAARSEPQLVASIAAPATVSAARSTSTDLANAAIEQAKSVVDDVKNLIASLLEKKLDESTIKKLGGIVRTAYEAAHRAVNVAGKPYRKDGSMDEENLRGNLQAIETIRQEISLLRNSQPTQALARLEDSRSENQTPGFQTDKRNLQQALSYLDSASTKLSLLLSEEQKLARSKIMGELYFIMLDCSTPLRDFSRIFADEPRSISTPSPSQPSRASSLATTASTPASAASATAPASSAATSGLRPAPLLSATPSPLVAAARLGASSNASSAATTPSLVTPLPSAYRALNTDPLITLLITSASPSALVSASNLTAEDFSTDKVANFRTLQRYVDEPEVLKLALQILFTVDPLSWAIYQVSHLTAVMQAATASEAEKEQLKNLIGRLRTTNGIDPFIKIMREIGNSEVLTRLIRTPWNITQPLLRRQLTTQLEYLVAQSAAQASASVPPRRAAASSSLASARQPEELTPEAQRQARLRQSMARVAESSANAAEYRRRALAELSANAQPSPTASTASASGSRGTGATAASSAASTPAPAAAAPTALSPDQIRQQVGLAQSVMDEVTSLIDLGVDKNLTEPQTEAFGTIVKEAVRYAQAISQLNFADAENLATNLEQLQSIKDAIAALKAPALTQKLSTIARFSQENLTGENQQRLFNQGRINRVKESLLEVRALLSRSGKLSDIQENLRRALNEASVFNGDPRILMN